MLRRGFTVEASCHINRDHIHTISTRLDHLVTQSEIHKAPHRQFPQKKAKDVYNSP